MTGRLLIAATQPNAAQPVPALLDSRAVASVAIRCTLLVLSLAAVAWMALSIRALDLEAEGRAVAARAQDTQITAAELERGRSAFESARRFNADKTPALHEAFLMLTVGRVRDALALAEDVVADEPDNRGAWSVVYRTAQALDARATEARAVRALRAIDPQNARAFRSWRDGG